MTLLTLAILKTALVGVDSLECPPKFERLRYNEDHACLGEDDASILPKRLDIGESYSLTVGGEFRQRLTYVKNFEFGASQTDGDWYNTQRYFVHLDQRILRDLQVFLQLGSMVQVDLETGPSPIERNDFDLLQAFARYDAGWLHTWAGRVATEIGGVRQYRQRRRRRWHADGIFGAFPRGNYFSEAAVLGPRNFYNVHAFLRIAPTAGWSHTVDVNWYWRLRDEDDVYGPPGNLILNPGGEGELVTTAISNGTSWTLNRYFDASAIYTIQTHGELARAQGSPRNTHFIELTLRARY